VDKYGRQRKFGIDRKGLGKELTEPNHDMFQRQNIIGNQQDPQPMSSCCDAAWDLISHCNGMSGTSYGPVGNMGGCQCYSWQISGMGMPDQNYYDSTTGEWVISGDIGQPVWQYYCSPPANIGSQIAQCCGLGGQVHYGPRYNMQAPPKRRGGRIRKHRRGGRVGRRR